MKLEKIKHLIEKGEYDEASRECERLVHDYPEEIREILRTRADALAIRGDYDSALKDHEAIIALEDGTIRDYYQAAFHALCAKQFAKASDWFQETLRMGDKQKESWFKSASYFYLAYAQMELENYNEAIRNLSLAVEVEADVGMPIPDVGMCSNEELKDEILRRRVSFSEPHSYDPP